MTKISQNSYIRPEHINISENGKYDAIIKSIVFYGSFYEIIIKTQNEKLLVHSFDDNLEVNQNIKYDFQGEILTF
jgi:iron(III) transport system ATP-binding protein/spermidine/putrescine transport system ATP-binding protein